MPTKGEQSKERILETANRLFYERGFNSTSFQDIAEVSGVPKGNFYFYFKSKGALLETVIEGRLERFREALTGWERDLSTPKERLLRCIDMLVNDRAEIERYGCPMGSLSLEIGKQQPEMKKQAAKIFRLLVDWNENQLRELDVGDQAPALAHRLIARLQGASVLAFVLEDKIRAREEIDDIKAWIEAL